MSKNVQRGLMLAGVLATVATSASAAQDVTALTGAITDIAAVGTAVFGVIVAIKLTKWVRRAL